MQTFLPYADLTESLRVLDNKRLGKQRVETYQIISAITGGTSNCTGISCNYHKCPFNKNISDSCDKSVIRNRTTEPTEHQWRVLIKLAIHGEYEL